MAQRLIFWLVSARAAAEETRTAPYDLDLATVPRELLDPPSILVQVHWLSN